MVARARSPAPLPWLAALLLMVPAAPTRATEGHAAAPRGPVHLLENRIHPSTGAVPPRIGAVVLPLADGRYLVAGGEDAAGEPVRETYVFRPEPFLRPRESPREERGGDWVRAGPLRTPRRYASAALLADGWVLVAGGFGPDGKALRSAEVYDPRRGTWHPTGALHRARAGAAMVRLRNGRVLVAGGHDRRRRPTATLETFDPVHAEFDEHPWRLPEPAAFPAACRLRDGCVLLTGGWTGDHPSEQIVLFDEHGGPYAPRAGSPRHHHARGSLRIAGRLAGPRAGHRMRRLGEVVLIAGGVFGEPCRDGRAADPPEVWDPARPHVTSAFEWAVREKGRPPFRLDDRLPHAAPHPAGDGCTATGLPPCAAPAEPYRAVDSHLWIFPSGRRWPFDHEHGVPESPPLEPRDRIWPWDPYTRDPRPTGATPWWPDLLERKSP